MPAIRGFRHLIYVIAAVALWCGRAMALNPALDLSQYAHTAWNVRDGFPSGVVYAMAQTPDGYIWLGTEFGLVRFDGVRSVSWQFPEGQRLPSDHVHALAVSRDGEMWIGTTAGLARWDGKTLTRYPEVAGRVVSSIVDDRRGTIWAGSSRVDSSAKICAIRLAGTECFGDDGSLGKSIRLHEDRAGNLWAATEHGLWRWAPGSPRLVLPIPDPRVSPVIDDSDGKLVIATRNSIRMFADEKFGPELISIPDSMAISSALRDRDGALWIGTSGGLLHRHDGRNDSYTRLDGLPDDRVTALFEDSEGSIWVSTVTGLNRFREYAIPAIGEKQGVQGFAAAVETTNDGVLWIGTSSGLYKSVNGAIAPYRHAVAAGIGRRAKNSAPNQAGQPEQEAHAPLVIESATALHADKRGRLWISTSRGVFYIEGDALRAAGGLRNVQARSISDGEDGDVWFSDFLGGLFRIRSDGDVQATASQTLGQRAAASSLLADPAGGLWIGFLNGGIGLLRNGELHRVPGTGEGAGTGASVWDLYLDREHTLWAATQRGLVRIIQDRAATLTSKEGLPCDAVHWVTEDDVHSFWVGLACGVARVDRAELAAWSADPTRKVRVQTFGREDGVINGAVAYGGELRVTKTRDGKLYFHSSDGVGVIDPRHLPFNKLPPPVQVEQIVADRKPYDASSHLKLPPLVRDLEIQYTGLSFVVPEKVQFKYKLEGRDRDWQDAGNRRRAFYTDLPPGDYRFRVIAANNSGVWNEQGATLDFSVEPAYWQTNWFRVLVVTALLALAYAIYRLRVAQIARHFNETLDARVAERTRIARELHDTLLQSFHGLLLRFQTARALLPGNATKAAEVLDSAIDQAAEAVTEGRDAVQDLRTSASEMNDLADAIRALGEQLGSDNGAGATLRVDVQGAPRALHPIVRDEVFRIAGEALRNAFRHSGAKQLEVELSYDDRQMRLRVRDDGKGIDAKLLDEGGREGHFGLRGMRERAKLIGGKLTIWTGLDAGTEVELVVPASHAYVSRSSARSGIVRKFFGQSATRDS